jgi:RNA polymerase sigma factor (sigma-70 family)
MRDSAAAEILPIAIQVNGKVFYWTRAEGLDVAVVAQVEGWIQRRADLYLQAATMRGLDRDDLLQEGRSGALRAARDYDPAFGTGYLSYADHWIRQAMRAALGRSHDIYLDKRARAQALKDNTLPPVLRLDARLRDNDTAFSDLLPSTSPDPLHQAEQSEAAARLWQALGQLDPRHRAVLIRRYGLKGPEESLESVGQRLGCTREPVRRLQLRAEAKLRALLQETAMPKAAPPAGAKPAANPKPPHHRAGTQLTIEDRIRERDRALAQDRRQAKEAARAEKKARKDAAKGTPLFGLEVAHD